MCALLRHQHSFNTIKEPNNSYSVPSPGSTIVSYILLLSVLSVKSLTGQYGKLSIGISHHGIAAPQKADSTTVSLILCTVIFWHKNSCAPIYCTIHRSSTVDKIWLKITESFPKLMNNILDWHQKVKDKERTVYNNLV